MNNSSNISNADNKIISERSKVEKNPQDKNYKEIKNLEMEFVGFIINSEDFINIAKQYIKPDSFISKEAGEFYKKALISVNYKDRNMFLRNELTEEESNFMYNSSTKEYKDIQSVFEDYLSFFKLRELEKELENINKEIKKAELNKIDNLELLEKKQFLISSIQKLKEYRKKIYKNE